MNRTGTIQFGGRETGSGIRSSDAALTAPEVEAGLIASPPLGIGTESLAADPQHSGLTRRQLLIYTGLQLFPDVLLYDAVWVIRLKDVDLPAFESTFSTLVQSYDALRTVVEDGKDGPYQRVRHELPFRLVHFDLRDREQPDAAADTWARERCQIPLNPAERVFDTALLRTGQTDYVWYLNIHHIVADGWAIDVLVRSFFRLYARARSGERLTPIRAPSFQDYVRRECDKTQLPKYREAEAYWRDRLSTPREMPCFFGHRTLTSCTSKRRLVIELGQQATERFNALVRRADVFINSFDATSANVLAALLFAYAYRSSGLRDLALGVAFHNRTADADKQLVGLVMEVLPFLLTVNPERSFIELVQSVHAVACEMLPHRAYSVGNPVQSPVYDMFLNVARTIKLEQGQGHATRVFPGHGETSLSLTVFDAGGPDSLQLLLDVRTDLLDTVGDEAFAERFETLVKAAIAQPDLPIAKLPLVTEAERQQVLVDWNKTSVIYPDDCIHQLFEFQVTRAPDATAVVCGEQH